MDFTFSATSESQGAIAGTPTDGGSSSVGDLGAGERRAETESGMEMRVVIVDSLISSILICLPSSRKGEQLFFDIFPFDPAARAQKTLGKSHWDILESRPLRSLQPADLAAPIP
jgi:hypothetical protein